MKRTPRPDIAFNGAVAMRAMACLCGVFSIAGCGPKNPLPAEGTPAWMQQAAVVGTPVSVQEGFSEGGSPAEAGTPAPVSAAGGRRRLTRVPVENLPDGRRIQQVWIWQETDDCLWNMAREFYGDPFLWAKIYEANRDIIRDPRVIFPKQRIVIPPLEDR